MKSNNLSILNLLYCAVWQARRDSNPQSWFWRPVVCQLTDGPIRLLYLLGARPIQSTNTHPEQSMMVESFFLSRTSKARRRTNQRAFHFF